MATLAYPVGAEHERNLTVIKSWDFFVWDYSSEERIRFAMSMYVDLGLTDEFRIPPDKASPPGRKGSRRWGWTWRMLGGLGGEERAGGGGGRVSNRAGTW